MTKKRFDKKNATTFQLVHRSQRDAEYHNDEVSKRVLVPISSRASSGKPQEDCLSPRNPVETKDDLAKQYETQVRHNEGEAAEYGIYYDDSTYDYMQHLRHTGTPGGVMLQKATEFKPVKSTDPVFRLPKEVVASTVAERPFSHQDQQSIQDSVSGFRPDLDPRIREVLLALDEDDATYEGASDEWFQEISLDHESGNSEAGAWNYDHENGGELRDDDLQSPSNWEQEYSRFKSAGHNSIDEEGSMISHDSTLKPQDSSHPAKESTSMFSMTSSILRRTEGMTLLDDRFDRIDREYSIDDEEEVGEPLADSQQAPVRADFDSILEDFLGEYANLGNKGQAKKARNPYSLADIRAEMKR